MQREIAIDLADRVEERRLRLGIAAELGLDPLRAAIENFASGDRLPLRVRRIRLPEQAGDEPRHAFDPRGFGAGAIPLDGRDRLLLPGAPRLDHRRDEADRERGDDQRSGEHRRAMPRHELPRAIRPAVRPGGDRQPVEMARDVLLQEVDRGVAARGILVQRLHHDRVQVAGEAALQPIGARAPDTGDLLGVVRDGVRRGIDAADRSQRADGAARRRRLALADAALDVGRRLRREPVRLEAGEELIEHGAERVHIGGGRDRRARHLLGARVVRREQLGRRFS